MRTINLPLPALLATLVFTTAATIAHEGEDHSHDKKKPSATAAVASGAAGTPSTPAAPQRLADGSLFIPKPVQRQLGLRTQPAKLGDLAVTIELNGRVIADPQSSGRVQASIAGTLVARPKGMPLPGTTVTRGELLAYLQPLSSAIERGNQQSQLAELDAQVAIAERRVTRLASLAGAVPQKDIDGAQIERDALQKRRAFVNASINTPQALLAPTAGVISQSHTLQAGQVVDTKEILFEIIDPSRLSVEALAYDPLILSTLVSASALIEQTPLELTFIGGGRQLREQALPLLFRIIPSKAVVVVGQPVKVIVRTAQGIKGAAIPRSALTKVGSGQETTIWVHTEAERFVARRVRVRALDATTVAIEDGMHEGDRVVTEGAGLLSQVR